MRDWLARTSASLILNLAVGVVFLGAAVALVVLVNYHMRQQALVEAESKARIILDRNLATHTYFSHNLKPNLFEWTDPFRPDDYFDPVWMSSTYAVREIDGYFQDLSVGDYYYKEAAINARSPANEADEYERAFIEELNADPSLELRSLVRILDGEPYFVTLRRGEVMEQACLYCHSTPAQAPADLVTVYGGERSFDRDVGEVVSAISIRVPLAEAYARADRFSLQLSGLLLVLLLGLFAAQYWISRRVLLTPLGRMRDKALRIASGEERVGEQLPVPVGSELGELMAAFNTMSLNLRSNMNGLEERVRQRTVELERLNDTLEKLVVEKVRELELERAKVIHAGKLASLGEMATGVAHELNQPLSAMLFEADYLKEMAGRLTEGSRLDADELLKVGEDLANDIARCRKIIDHLRTFGRASAEETSPVSLNQAIENSLTLIEQRLRGRGVELHLNLSPDLPLIEADLQRLEQVFLNLINNAEHAIEVMNDRVKAGEIDLAGYRGEIKISTCVKDGQVVVVVTDNGCGIPEADKPRMFEPFFTTKPVGKGTGLGLSISYGIVTGFGAEIEFESAENSGTTFTLRFPALS